MMRRLNLTSLKSRWVRIAGALAVAGLLAGCQADELGYGPKASRSVQRQTEAALNKLGIDITSPVLMRIFKEDSDFEVWKMGRDGKYQLVRTYKICSWSGKLGPKVFEGDRQAPEGYYPISPGLMNPNSNYYLAFNTGFPNAYDRANNRTGSALMVHGSCSSRGCYAMTDAQIQDIYALARDAFRGGQKAFQLQAYPFRMTPENMAKHWDNPNMPFWKMLKEGYDTFELTRQEPKVDVCGRKYVFNSTPNGPMSPAAACPELVQPEGLKQALAAKAKADEEKAVVIVAKLEADRKAADQQQILLAQEKENAAKTAAGSQVATADGGQSAGSIFGSVAATNEAVAPDGPPVAAPPPRANPLGPFPSALAMSGEGEKPTSGGLFGSLFSSDAPADVPPAAAAAIPAATPQPAAQPVASAQPVDAAQPVAAAPACLTVADPAQPTVPVCAPPVVAVPEEKSGGLIDSLGSLF